MPVGYSARCRVCNSPYRAEIERWSTEEGLSPRAISARLFERYGEKINHVTIWKHMQEHFNIKPEVREQYEKSRQQFSKAVQKRLSDIEMLDVTIADNFELSQATKAWLNDLIEQRKTPPLALVQLREKLQSEMRQAIRQKLELVGDDPMSRLADGVATWAELVQAAIANGDK